METSSWSSSCSGMCTNWRGRSSPAAYPIKSKAVNRVCSTVTNDLHPSMQQYTNILYRSVMRSWICGCMKRCKHTHAEPGSYDACYHTHAVQVVHMILHDCCTTSHQQPCDSSACQQSSFVSHATSGVHSCCTSKLEMPWWRARCKKHTWRREETKTRTGLRGECVCMAA